MRVAACCVTRCGAWACSRRAIYPLSLQGVSIYPLIKACYGVDIKACYLLRVEESFPALHVALPAARL